MNINIDTDIDANVKKEAVFSHLVGTLRIALGFIFLWAFIEKVPAALSGTSPAYGFLTYGTSGPFAPFFQSLAGNAIVDFLYMAGLLGVGLALMLGIGMKIAGISGALMMTLIYLAALPPEHNPVIDEHIIYALLVLLFIPLQAGTVLGFGNWWRQNQLVKRFPILE
ncbi:MAG: hypothetical protein COW88_00570 [Candidatus Lloydbacteria bacterium CG22_combo_CG10-13_8_21_14_all_47_15]|uniref:DoxX family protein n=1 Tax=Candidatus Lloydbacteria bacterium CG22_combo_CG10-13_8_21_14_all_47_15 TaxID=1974635 RepID=A0A2H0CVI8_9BACT|nr:MAG: hypothetical protein COW88_00570 [Candidatus Lloydbacteria bacterium CG22_combo_CG10-13_8_21_14_all_47_15]